MESIEEKRTGCRFSRQTEAADDRIDEKAEQSLSADPDQDPLFHAAGDFGV